jgi:hypothetical protein
VVEFVPACPGDADWLAPRLRLADVLELQALHGASADPHRCLLTALRVDPAALAAVGPDGAPIALLGCAEVSALCSEARPWMLGTPEVERHARVVLAEGRRRVAGWSRVHRVLRNWVDARNLRSVGWLRRLGFQILPAAPHGAQGLLFHEFTLVRVAAAAPSTMDAAIPGT